MATGDAEGAQKGAWCCSGSRAPRSEIVFVCQITLVFCVVVASIYNLTTERGDRDLWVALLSSCIGYVIPNPKIP